MATIPQNTTGFSTPVTLELHVQGQVLSVAKVGPERLFLRDENANPRGAATLVITVGGTTKQTPIMIDENRCDGREIGYW